LADRRRRDRRQGAVRAGPAWCRAAANLHIIRTTGRRLP
jgi:hypothetical protein